MITIYSTFIIELYLLSYLSYFIVCILGASESDCSEWIVSRFMALYKCTYYYSNSYIPGVSTHLFGVLLGLPAYLCIILCLGRSGRIMASVYFMSVCFMRSFSQVVLGLPIFPVYALDRQVKCNGVLPY